MVDFQENPYFVDYALTSYAYIPTVPTVFSDIILDSPVPSLPLKNSIICLADGEIVTPTWGSVTNASNYVIQICENSQFVGPTLRAYDTLNTDYDFTIGTDIFYGHTYFWRVMAYNTTGGAGPKSEPYAFKIECPIVGTDPSDADCSDVEILLNVPTEQQECNISFVVTADYSISDPSLTVTDAVWSWNNNTAPVTEAFRNEYPDPLSIGFSVPGCDSNGTLEITVTVTVDPGGGDPTFDCTATASIEINCDLLDEKANPGLAIPLGTSISEVDTYYAIGAMYRSWTNVYVPECDAYRDVYTDYPFVQLDLCDSTTTSQIGSAITGVNLYAENYALFLSWTAAPIFKTVGAAVCDVYLGSGVPDSAQVGGVECP